ncbi:MAG TPA: hypothetical protein PLX35_14465 [Cyclobacteriaceae bacterium]|nr:hypothetical protein [Cyclobacteriaceae bacterium]
MKQALAIVLILLSVESFAQGSEYEREKLREIEQSKEFARNRQIRQQMDSGIYLLEHEEYAKADIKLRYALDNMKSVPSDLVYYFGKNSYYIAKYKQSVDWLSKYIQLKGTTGQYSADAAAWLAKAEASLIAEQQVGTQKASEVLSKDYMIDCGPSGKVTCPVCNGTTVIIKKDYLGEKYKSCPYCSKHGYLTCEEYNQLLRGQLKAH